MTLTPEDLERVLRGGGPIPRPDFVRALELSLIPPRPRTDRGRMRVAITGLGLAVALAATVIALGAAGVLPIQLGGGSGAQADRDCRIVTVKRIERVPSFVRGSDGEFVVRYHTQIVSRPVRRCR